MSVQFRPAPFALIVCPPTGQSITLCSETRSVESLLLFETEPHRRSLDCAYFGARSRHTQTYIYNGRLLSPDGVESSRSVRIGGSTSPCLACDGRRCEFLHILRNVCTFVPQKYQKCCSVAASTTGRTRRCTLDNHSGCLS